MRFVDPPSTDNRNLTAQTSFGRILFWGLLAVGLLWAAYLGLHSTGSPYEDEIAHYLLNRTAWQQPELILNRWGRPIYTLLYMPPSLAGLAGARLFSIALDGLTVYLASRIAFTLGLRRLWLIPLLFCFQPWFGPLLHGAITQVPFMLCLTLALYLWLKERWLLASLVFGLLPMLRDESLVLVGLWGLYMLYRRQWKAAILSGLPVIVYNALFMLVLQVPLNQTPVANYISPTTQNIYFDYGTKPITFYPFQVLLGIGPVILLLAGLGLKPALKIWRRMIPLSFYVIFFLLHVVISVFGLYQSGNYGLFILPVAPVFAILAALGAEWLLDRVAQAARNRPARVTRAWNTAALLAILIVPLPLALRCGPTPLSEREAAIRDAAIWLQTEGYADKDVIAPHFYYYYFSETPWTPDNFWGVEDAAAQAAPGTILIWEDQYAQEMKLNKASLSAPDSGWRMLQGFAGDMVIIYQRLPEDQSEHVGLPSNG